AAASTHIDRTIWITYLDLPVERGRATLEVDALVRRNIFYRFFGLGPDSLESDQSSYTRTVAGLTARWGWNFPAHFNLGARGTVRGDSLLRNPIFGLPATQDLFPTAPGIDGAGVAAGELSLRFDTRPAAEYSDTGVAAELRAAYDRPLTSFEPYWQLTGQARALYRENSFLQSAARVYWTRELGGGAEIPFYYQAILGGDSLLRGFPDDRFIDRAAWEAEIEQRFRLLETHIFGVTTDWRVDPFVAAGQVYDRFAALASNVQVSVGAGLRAWVKPNVLGRVDVAYAGEGINVYVVLGYPY
ncbi:MAG TPA: BamA/TamA family outer membrane protein, partial [Polyangia bacterium]|nr:BamA/TamA family outer membrane protein [Polyangia bacterium]